MTLADLRITYRPDIPWHQRGTGYGMRIELDGHEIPAVQALKLVVTRDDLNTLTLTIGVDQVDISTDVIAVLEAHANIETPEEQP